MATASLAQQSAEALHAMAVPLIQAQQYEQALPLVTEAAAMGLPEAQFHLGVMYANGLGVAASDSLAIHWWTLAATNGWKDAQFTMAKVYLGQNNAKEGLLWMRKAADNGDFEAKYLLAFMQLEGKYMPVDTSAGFPAARHLCLDAKPITHDDSAYVALIRCQFASGLFKDIWQAQLQDREVYAWLLICNETKYLLPYTRQNEIIYQLEQLGFNLSEGERDASAEYASMLLKGPLRRRHTIGTME
jgi:TPR repeat protein